MKLGAESNNPEHILKDDYHDSNPSSSTSKTRVALGGIVYSVKEIK